MGRIQLVQASVRPLHRYLVWSNASVMMYDLQCVKHETATLERARMDQYLNRRTWNGELEYNSIARSADIFCSYHCPRIQRWRVHKSGSGNKASGRK